MSKKVNRKNYEEQIKEGLRKYKEILNKRFKLNLNNNFESNIVDFFHNLLDSIQPKNNESS